MKAFEPTYYNSNIYAPHIPEGIRICRYFGWFIHKNSHYGTFISLLNEKDLTVKCFKLQWYMKKNVLITFYATIFQSLLWRKYYCFVSLKVYKIYFYVKKYHLCVSPWYVFCGFCYAVCVICAFFVCLSKIFRKILCFNSQRPDNRSWNVKDTWR